MCFQLGWTLRWEWTSVHVFVGLCEYVLCIHHIVGDKNLPT